MFRMLMLVVPLVVWGGFAPAYSQEAPVGAVEQVASDVMVGDLVAEEVVVAVGGPMLPVEEKVEPPVEESVPVPPEVDLDALESMTKTPVGLSLLVGFIVWFLMEIGKALIKKFGEASTGVKWAVSVLSGAVFGLLFGLFGGVTFPWWVALLSGMAGSASFSGVRQLRNSFRPVNSNGFGQVSFLLLLLILSAGVLCLGVVGCGTTFTAKAGEPTITSIHRGPPGQMIVKVADKTACTVNSAPGDEMLISNSCEAGFVPWYEGVIVTCISDPCDTGSLTHNPDGTVGCQ